MSANDEMHRSALICLSNVPWDVAEGSPAVSAAVAAVGVRGGWAGGAVAGGLCAAPVVGLRVLTRRYIHICLFETPTKYTSLDAYRTLCLSTEEMKHVLMGMGVMCARPGASAYQALYDDEDGLLESFAGYWRVSHPTAAVGADWHISSIVGSE